MKRLLLFISIFLLCSVASAAPVIDSTTGTFLQGEVVTMDITNINADLSGSTTLVFDSLEGGAFADYWAGTNSLTVDGSVGYGQGSKSSSLNFNGSGDNGWVAGASSPTDMKWFCSYRFKLDEDWDWGTSVFNGTNKFLSNIKIFRMWNPGATTENFVIALQGWGDSIVYTTEKVGESGGGSFESGYQTSFSKGSYHQLSFQFMESSLDTLDGSISVWLDGQAILVDNTIKTRGSFTGMKRPLILGFDNVWSWDEDGGSGPDPSDDNPNGYHMDDIFANNSWVRAEVGDDPDYESCNNREICEVTDITGNTVTITFNQGAFNVEETVYLFFVDKDGIASVGVAIVIGGTASANAEATVKITGNATITGNVSFD